jgi:dinuclear metal center YbgI/SA1388 family protein
LPHDTHGSEANGSMTKAVHHISGFFDHWAPFSTQAEYDNAGLLLGSEQQQVTGILTCLDVTEAVADEAIAAGCNLIVAHHPLIFRKLARINPDTPQGSLLYKLIRHDIAVLAVHTNLDAAKNGVSFVLAELLGIQNPVFLTHHDEDKSTGFGVFGQLGTSLTLPGFLDHVCKSLGTSAVRYAYGQHTASEQPAPANTEPIRTVAVCGGTGVSLASAARKAGAQAYVTADIKYHEYFDPGLVLIDAGHYETEVPIVNHLTKILLNAFPGVRVQSARTRTNPMHVHISKNFQTQ